MNRKKIYYLAYGSNLSERQMFKRMRTWIKTEGTYRLQGWKLTLNCGSQAYPISYANIEEASDTDFVEGVLYQLDHEQLKTLDWHEGLYERVFFDLPEKGKDALLCVYIAYPYNISKTRPTIDYLNTCMEGALEHGLYQSYRIFFSQKTKINEKNRNSRVSHR